MFYLLLCITCCTVLKAEETCGESCDRSDAINEIKSVIIRTFGKSRGGALIKEVEESPRDHLNSDTPIAVELAEVLMEDMIFKLTVSDLYKQIIVLQDQLDALKQERDTLNEKLQSLTVRLLVIR